MDRKKVIIIIIVSAIMMGVNNNIIAYGKTRVNTSGMNGDPNWVKSFKQRDSWIKGVDVNEILSKTTAIRKARTIFSGYSVRDDNAVINEKFKGLKKK